MSECLQRFLQAQNNLNMAFKKKKKENTLYYFILVQNRIFTAKAQRTQSRYFLFGGERPPNKKVSVQGSYHVP